MSNKPPTRQPPGAPPGAPPAKAPPGMAPKAPPGMAPPGMPAKAPPGMAPKAPPGAAAAPAAPPRPGAPPAPPAPALQAPAPQAKTPPGAPVPPAAAKAPGAPAPAPAAKASAAKSPAAKASAAKAPGLPAPRAAVPAANANVPRGTRTALGDIVLSAKNAARVHPHLPEPVALLVDSMLVLTDLVTSENDCLKRHDMPGVSALQDRKLAGHYLFEERLIGARRDGNLLRALPADQREAVLNVWRGLERLTQENVALLRATIKATEIIFTALKDAAVTASGQEMIYSRRGQASNPMPACEASLAYNSVT